MECRYETPAFSFLKIRLEAVRFIFKNESSTIVVYHSHTRNDINHSSYTIHRETQIKIQYRRILLFQVRTRLLTSDFGSSTQGGRHNS